MLKKFTNPYNDSVLLIQRPKEVQDFLARHPRVLPVAPAQRPADSRAYRLAIRALRIVAVLVGLLFLALCFFLFGEERPERVRPELTPAQRAAAYRLPTP